ncbi:MAG: hypothetical protein ACRD3G_11430 [Vicinamibacterales bacterium]
MATFTVKATCRVKEFTPALLHILVRTERFVDTLVEVDEVVVTSINDSAHGAGSRHYTNEALDIRTKNWPSRESVRWFRRALEEQLGLQFRVLLEDEGTQNEHLHVQVRKGHIYERVPF